MRSNRPGRSYIYRAVCDRCGFKKYSYELRQEWDGFMVCKDCWEPRHILDFYRPRDDTHRLPWTRDGQTAISTSSMLFNGTQCFYAPFDNEPFGIYTVNNDYTWELSTAGTYEAWFKIPAGTTGGTQWVILSQARSAAQGGMKLWINPANGNLSIRRENSGAFGDLTSAVDYRDGTWHHVAATWTNAGNALVLYVDGTSAANTTYATVGAMSGNNLSIGSVVNNTSLGAPPTVASSTLSFKGYLSEVRVWSTARSATQVGQYKNLQALGTESGLVVCYHLNGGRTDRVADGIPRTNYRDYSGRIAAGTLVYSTDGPTIYSSTGG